MDFLIDTNILIYRLKNMGNVNSNFSKYKDVPMAISVISYGELIFGARKSKFVEQNLGVAKNIGEIFPLLDVTSKVMDIFGEIKVYTQKTGNPIDDFDLLIAATAIANNMTLVTHNTKHFDKIPNLIITDWF